MFLAQLPIVVMFVILIQMIILSRPNYRLHCEEESFHTSKRENVCNT